MPSLQINPKGRPAVPDRIPAVAPGTQTTPAQLAEVAQ